MLQIVLRDPDAAYGQGDEVAGTIAWQREDVNISSSGFKDTKDKISVTVELVGTSTVKQKYDHEFLRLPVMVDNHSLTQNQLELPDSLRFSFIFPSDPFQTRNRLILVNQQDNVDRLFPPSYREGNLACVEYKLHAIVWTIPAHGAEKVESAKNVPLLQAKSELQFRPRAAPTLESPPRVPVIESDFEVKSLLLTPGCRDENPVSMAERAKGFFRSAEVPSINFQAYMDRDMDVYAGSSVNFFISIKPSELSNTTPSSSSGASKKTPDIVPLVYLNRVEFVVYATTRYRRKTVIRPDELMYHQYFSPIAGAVKTFRAHKAFLGFFRPESNYSKRIRVPMHFEPTFTTANIRLEYSISINVEIECLGQTFEPFSPAAQYPFSVLPVLRRGGGDRTVFPPGIKQGIGHIEDWDEPEEPKLPSYSDCVSSDLGYDDIFAPLNW